MTDETRTLKAIARKLREAEEMAARIEHTMANGAFLDCLIGNMADEIDILLKLKKEAKEAE